MDTKQKRRGGEQDRRQRQGGAKRPTPEERPRKQPPQQQKKRRALEQEGRKVPRPADKQERRGAPRQERRHPAPQREQQRAPRREQLQQTPQQEQLRQLPQEEVYRPTPSQERHSQETRQGAARRKRPDQSAARETAASRGRTAGSTAAKRRRPAGEKSKTRPTRRNVRPPRKNAPAVIYTQPAPFNLNRLLIQLLTVTAVVLALTLGLSIFFKVEVVTVSGADVYSEWAIREASGIQEGDALLTFSRARAAARIRAELPYVERVRFGIKLPNTVIIDIEELEVVYAVQDKDGLWWFITSQGRVVEQTDGGTANNYTKIVGIMLDSPISNEMAIAYETAAPTTEATTSTDASEDPLATAPATTTNADRLAVALMIVQELEDNDVVGEVASVDVTNLSAIELWYGTRYEVELGNADNLDYKITCMQDAVNQMSDYQMGVLDITFGIWQDKVVFTPFTD